MDITSLMTIRIILSFSSENKSHRIKVAFPMSREKKDSFPNRAQNSQLMNLSLERILTSYLIIKSFSKLMIKKTT